MLHTRDAQSYPLHGVHVVHERPKPKYPLRDLVKLWQEAKQREEEADRRTEHWHHAYNILKQDYAYPVNESKTRPRRARLPNCVTSVPPAAKPERA